MGLDAVEIVMAWEDSFGVVIPDQEAADLRTPRLAVDLICRKLAVKVDASTGCCLCGRAFYRLRRAFMAVLDCPREAIVPRARLSNVASQWSTHKMRAALATQLGVPAMPRLLFGSASLSPYRTFGDLARFLVANHAHSLWDPVAGWAHGQVREVVRAVVSEQLGIPEFSDDADFVHDLGID